MQASVRSNTSALPLLCLEKVLLGVGGNEDLNAVEQSTLRPELSDSSDGSFYAEEMNGLEFMEIVRKDLGLIFVVMHSVTDTVKSSLNILTSQDAQ